MKSVGEVSSMMSDWSMVLDVDVDGESTERMESLSPEMSSTESLSGMIRLVRHLASTPQLANRRCCMVVDSGTGTTAVGLATGVALYGYPLTDNEFPYRVVERGRCGWEALLSPHVCTHKAS